MIFKQFAKNVDRVTIVLLGHQMIVFQIKNIFKLLDQLVSIVKNIDDLIFIIISANSNDLLEQSTLFFQTIDTFLATTYNHPIHFLAEQSPQPQTSQHFIVLNIHLNLFLKTQLIIYIKVVDIQLIIFHRLMIIFIISFQLLLHRLQHPAQHNIILIDLIL